MALRRPVTQVAVVAFAVLLCTTACAASAGRAGKTTAAHPQAPAVFASIPAQAAPTTLRPVSWMSTHLPDPHPLRATLRGTGKDTLAIASPQPGQGTLTITDSTGHTIFTLGYTAEVSVLDYGSKHLPVILTQADGCGTGGCTYFTYTWNPGARKFTAIAPPGGTPAFRYLPAQKKFQPVMLPAPSLEPSLGWFGFIRPDAAGLSFTELLYDDWQNVAVNSYALAVDGSGDARWVSQGTSYRAPGPGIGPTFSGPGKALAALLQACSLNLPSEGMTLLPPGSAGKALWASLAPLQAWGLTLHYVGPGGVPQVTPGDGTDTMVATISGTSGSLNARLQAYRITATVKPVSNAWQITAVQLLPVRLQAASVSDVLELLLKDPSSVYYLSQHSADPLTINVIGLRWQLSLGQGGNRLIWQDVSAKSGAITPEYRLHP